MPESLTEPFEAKEMTIADEPAESRLSVLLQTVPNIQSAPALEGKLRLAAEGITTCGVATSCSVYLEDSKHGKILVVSHPEEDGTAANAVKRYWELRSHLGDTRVPKVVPAGESPEENIAVVLAPLRTREGKEIGLAELVCKDVSWISTDLSTTFQAFFDSLTESIDQFRVKVSLQKDESLYRTLIDNVSDVIFRVDREGNLTFVSRQVWNLLGLHWRDMLGKRATAYVVERDADRLREAFAAILNGESLSLDISMMRTDHSEVVVSISANPISE